MSLLCGGPVGYLETLEEGSWSSVEVDVSDSFEEGVWVEILSVDVELNVWLLVELIHIEVFNSNTYIILNCKTRYWQRIESITYFSGFLNVETIGDKS